MPVARPPIALSSIRFTTDAPVAGPAVRRSVQNQRAYLMQRVRFSPDDEKRQCRRRGLRCKMTLFEDFGGADVQPRMIPADCFNVSDTGLYGIVPIGFGVTLGQRYTFQLSICERGPDSGSQQNVTQQGTIVRSELLVGPEGQTDRMGVGVQLVGQRSGVIPMPA